eukprot:GHUV01058535.1.p1 GENE.GHUV01058535.1~~GHUV01058535.1.p1  ORF type:complete len:148 (-),score=34.68 GHUV01058535.1:153-596(-)
MTSTLQQACCRSMQRRNTRSWLCTSSLRAAGHWALSCTCCSALGYACLTHIFCLCAAPAAAYDMAKRIIHLVVKVGDLINKDPETKDLLRLYFLPDYNVSLAEVIIPGELIGYCVQETGGATVGCWVTACVWGGWHVPVLSTQHSTA